MPEQDLYPNNPPMPEVPKKNADSTMANVAGDISDLDRRLRILEERYGNLRRKTQLTEQNLVESEKNFMKELRTINEDVMDIKRSISDINEKIGMFVSEFETVAKKMDVKVIERYLDMWEPMNFVTRNELERIMDDREEKTK